MFVQVPASISGLFLVSSPCSKMLGRLVILSTITNLLKLEVFSQMSWFRSVSDLQIETKCCLGEETFENQVCVAKTAAQLEEHVCKFDI